MEAGVANDTDDPSQASCRTGETEDKQEDGEGKRRTTQVQKQTDATLTTKSLRFKFFFFKSMAAGKTLMIPSHCRSTESSSSLFVVS